MSKRLPVVFALLALCAVTLPARTGRCLQPGQEVAVSLDGLFMAGSVTSIIGNAIAIKRGQPSRAWAISGFILGTMNTVISPLLLVYGQDPDPAVGLGLGIAQGAIGVTNLVLSIYGGVLWNRQIHREGREGALAGLALVPITGRDGTGRQFAGAAVHVLSF